MIHYLNLLPKLLAAASLASQTKAFCLHQSEELGGIKLSRIGAVYFCSRGGRLKTSSSKKNGQKVGVVEAFPSAFTEDSKK